MSALLRTETILAEMTASLNGTTSFVYAKTWFKRPYPGCIGVVQLDLPGCDSLIVAKFLRADSEWWTPIDVTPFVRRAVARERGYVGPVYV